MIRFTDVKKVYQTGNGPVQALADLNLEVRRGEIFGIIGYSGAGKSTLIRLINLLEKPTEGRIEVEGRALNTLSEKELRLERKKIGMIFQHFNLLWSRTVEENIAFPLELAGLPRKKRKERVAELIRLVGLNGREHTYPSQLSGGQKQRVGIARALASRPQVLLCDEATSALDPKTTDSILNLLVEINRKLGLTIVLITHEMHVIKKICTRVAVLDKGMIVEEGKVEDVFNEPKQLITREFVRQVTQHPSGEIPGEELINAYPDGRLAKFVFGRGVSQQQVISRLFSNQRLSVTIVSGMFEPEENGAQASIIVRAEGDPDVFREWIGSISELGVKAEVIRS
ncbi:ATP-binding cassette domain-containing protein [Sporolactobacillus sp. THM7-4]|nr:ATP-binding cassette domain-containing protein [Sporolactobacillus sp. THM7-4]